MRESNSPRDDVSVASSATLQPEEDVSPPVGLARSLGALVLTPSDPQDATVQPPSSVAPIPQEEAPKKRKRKSRKKKKSANASNGPGESSSAKEPAQTTAAGVGSTTSGSSIDELLDRDRYDPFTSQMTHVEAIRRGVRDSKASYYAQTNAAKKDDELSDEAIAKFYETVGCSSPRHHCDNATNKIIVR